MKRLITHNIEVSRTHPISLTTSYLGSIQIGSTFTLYSGMANSLPLAQNFVFTLPLSLSPGYIFTPHPPSTYSFAPSFQLAPCLLGSSTRLLVYATYFFTFHIVSSPFHSLFALYAEGRRPQTAKAPCAILGHESPHRGGCCTWDRAVVGAPRQITALTSNARAQLLGQPGAGELPRHPRATCRR